MRSSGASLGAANFLPAGWHSARAGTSPFVFVTGRGGPCSPDALSPSRPRTNFGAPPSHCGERWSFFDNWCSKAADSAAKSRLSRWVPEYWVDQGRQKVTISNENEVTLNPQEIGDFPQQCRARRSDYLLGSHYDLTQRRRSAPRARSKDLI